MLLLPNNFQESIDKDGRNFAGKPTIDVLFENKNLKVVALFAPEQQTSLQQAIVQPEGRIYFAGEHCSLYHAWIQGSIESALRVSRQIHELPPAA